MLFEIISHAPWLRNLEMEADVFKQFIESVNKFIEVPNLRDPFMSATGELLQNSEFER